MLRLVFEGRTVLTHGVAVLFQAWRHGTMPVKDRHVYTRTGRLRLRYVAIMAVAFLGMASTNLSFVPPHSLEIASAKAGIADMAQVVALPSRQMALVNIAPVPMAPAKPHPANYTRTLTVQSGDTLSDLMQRVGTVNSNDAVSALKTHINPRALKAGQDITMHYKWSPQSGERLTAMEFEPSPLTRIVLRQGANGAFSVDKIQKELSAETRAARAVIRTSLYADLRRADVPDSIIAEFIKAYSYNVDFQRDIWAGDKVEILYSVDRTDDGQVVRGNKLVYATLYQRGNANTIVRFDHDGSAEYFDAKGNPVKKALLRTPVDGARMTSGFGMRRHPIQGYNKMHKGVDFGASTGTPIFAAGDGVVSRASWFSGYGKYVSIKHNGTYSTAYAHMSKINVKAGQRVKQGQVIGRVGTTGNSTGPHLHFEVLKGGTQVNPTKVANLSVGNKLGGKQLAQFQAVSANARNRFENIISGAASPKLASLSGGMAQSSKN